ncbi:MAG: hypothetical protein KDA92_21315, partial [Planctomycetales bacterium]|nr:hypothetical protein [Planctomycetales bacterium]
APTVTTRFDAGFAGADRVTLTWPDGLIKNTWLKVVVRANANTRLVEPDVHAWGNAIGETGNSVTNAAVDLHDRIAVSDNQTTFFSDPSVANQYDVNRDGVVDLSDRLIVADNQSTFLTELALISLDSGSSQSLASQSVGAALQELAQEPNSSKSDSKDENTVSPPVGLPVATIALGQPSSAVVSDMALESLFGEQSSDDVLPRFASFHTPLTRPSNVLRGFARKSKAIAFV